MKKNQNKYHNWGIIALLILVVSFMTVGYASYSQLLSFDGEVGLLPDGKFLVTEINLVDSSNVINSVTPVFDDGNIEFELVFGGEEDEYYALYSVDVVNNSHYDYTFNSFNFNPIVNASGGGEGTLTLEVFNIEEGDIIPAGSSLTIQLKLNLAVSDPDQEYSATATTDIEAQAQDFGTILATVSNITNDLRSDGSMATFKLTITNSYSKDISFYVNSMNTNFIICDNNGVALEDTLLLPANSENNEYTLYMKTNPLALFEEDTESTLIKIQAVGIGGINVGTLSYLVTISPDFDFDYVQIGPVTITQDKSSTDTANVSWSRLDNGGSSVKNYGVVMYRNGASVGVYNTNSANTEITISGLSNGTYYAIVYGEDKNTSGRDYLNTATESSTYARKSPSTVMNWSYSVTRGTVSGGSFSSLPATAYVNQDYEATFSPSNNYTLAKNNVTVTIGGSSYTDFTFNNNKITIPKAAITGAIVIGASATEDTCLVEGTMIRLANGSVKAIEDVQYTDLLLVWDFEHGKFTYEYPIWIEKARTSGGYEKITFSDGSSLKVVGRHGIFNVDLMKYVWVNDPNEFYVGARVLKNNNGKLVEVTVKKIEMIDEEVKYYDVISSTYYNLLAEDILVTDGNLFLANNYGFNDNFTWKVNRSEVIANSDNLYSYDELASVVPYHLFVGLRFSEVKYIVNNGGYSDGDLGHLMKIFDGFTTTLLKEPIKKNGKNVWMVTTSDDIKNNINIDKHLYYEGSVYKLPKPKNSKNFSYWYSTVDGKKYNPGDMVNVYLGMHFEAIYK